MGSKHTQEPWIVNGTIRIESEHEHGFVNDGWIIAEMCGSDAKANARRIVACVNACAGIDTDTLEGEFKNLGSEYVQVVQLLEVSDKRAESIIKQRDELLEALVLAEKALAHCKPDVGYSSKHTAASIAINRAIPKAKG